MKKKIFIITFLITTLVLTMFTGCSGEPQPLTICIDMEYLGKDYGYTAESTFTIFLNSVADAGGPEDVVIETLPPEGPERESALTRLRAEIMSGAGPDVFIMACAGGPFTNGGDALFPIPEKTLETGLFLTLDEYIENAQFMEWDKLTPAVMEAGRNEYGQQLLPLSYTLPITFFRQSEVTHEASKEITWNDMLEDENRILTAAAAWQRPIDAFEWYMMIPWNGDYLENILGELADYSEEELLFTEKELLQRTQEIIDLKLQYENGDFDSVPDSFQDTFTIGFDSEGISYGYDRFNGLSRTEDYTLVPLYSDDGGVTATILYYAAINSNTPRPEDAFFILDFLMSKSNQQNSGPYRDWFIVDGGIPLHEDLMQEAFPVRAAYSATNGWYLSENNYSEFCEVRDQITHTRFRGGLDLNLDAMFSQCQWKYEKGESYEEIVAEAYGVMDIMIGE